MSKKIEILFNGDMDISEIEKSVKTVKTLFGNLKLPADLASGFEEAMRNVEGSIKDFQKISSTPITNKKDLTQLQNSFTKLSRNYNALVKESEALEKTLSKTSKIKLLTGNDKALFENISSILIGYSKSLQSAKDKGIILTQELKKQQNIAKDLAGYEKDISATEANRAKAQIKLRNEEEKLLNLRKKKGITPDELTTQEKKVEEQRQEYERLENVLENYRTVLKNYLNDNESVIQGVERYRQQIRNLETEISNLKNTDGTLEELKANLQNIEGFSELGIDLDKVTDVEELRAALDDILNNKLSSMLPLLRQINTEEESSKGNFNNIKTELDEVARSLQEQLSLEKQISQAASGVVNFFSISNAINLFKRVVSDAKQAVTELDAAMAETAVVTDYSISDMWDKLPEYTEMANKLGATLLGSYQTMTLYYQQGR